MSSVLGVWSLHISRPAKKLLERSKQWYNVSLFSSYHYSRLPVHERWKLSLICENWSGRDKIFKGVCKGKLFQFVFEVFYKKQVSPYTVSLKIHTKKSAFFYCIN